MAHIWTDNVSEGKNHAEMFPGSKCSSFTLRSNSLQIQGMENWIVLAGTLPFPIKSVRMAARVTCRARMIIWWATCLFVISTRTASIAAAAPGDLDRTLRKLSFRCDENTHDRTCPEPATKSGPSSSSSPSEEVAATTAAKVILDCDPGVDDLLAIWWMIGGHQRGLLELIAITTVAGNVDARLVHRNAVISTYFFPALRSKGLTFGRSGTRDDGSENESDLFYGDDGLGGLTEHLLQASNLSEALLPEYKSTASSPQLLVDLLLKHDMHSITIVAIGPLTNLAQAEKIRPGILSRAREIVIMGGGFGFDGTEDGYNARGNMNALAEFNFWSDAESAAAVMQTGARSSLRSTLTLVPLDVTQQVCWTPEQNKLLKDSIASILLRERNSGDGSRGGDDDGVKMEGGGGQTGARS
eukprot:jgi/Bigna1/145811/aug1.104_g20519